MEIKPEKQTQPVDKLRLGKSTGLPIDQHTNNNNKESSDNHHHHLHPDDAKHRTNDKKKLAHIFDRSFFSKSLRVFDSSAGSAKRQVTEVTESASNLSTGELSSSDEWLLLEPDEEDEQHHQVITTKLRSLSERQDTVNMPNQNNNNEHIANNNNNNNNDIHKSAKKYADLDTFGPKQALDPRLVHFCTALYALVPLASFLIFATLLCLLITRFWFITLGYYAYIFLDRQTCNRGGRRWVWIYRAKFWTYLSAYFPIRLRCSNDFKLDPRQNYLLNYHPHGIASFGCVASFATNGLNFSQLFPGIRSRFMVHEKAFCVPLMREIFSLRGDCSVNSKSLDYLLEKKWRQPESKQATGNLLALVGGGLAEADLSDAQALKVVVANRKGFVKKALIHGAHLIPCIAFGENSVFTKINFKPNSLLHRLESLWYAKLKFKHPFYYGLSVTGSNKVKGALPYRRPITVVMGDPIEVERVAEPTQQQIDQLHTRYLDQLKQVYAANSDLCSEFDQRLELV